MIADDDGEREKKRAGEGERERVGGRERGGGGFVETEGERERVEGSLELKGGREKKGKGVDGQGFHGSDSGFTYADLKSEP